MASPNHPDNHHLHLQPVNLMQDKTDNLLSQAMSTLASGCSDEEKVFMKR